MKVLHSVHGTVWSCIAMGLSVVELVLWSMVCHDSRPLILLMAQRGGESFILSLSHQGYFISMPVFYIGACYTTSLGANIIPYENRKYYSIKLECFFRILNVWKIIFQLRSYGVKAKSKHKVSANTFLHIHN